MHLVPRVLSRHRENILGLGALESSCTDVTCRSGSLLLQAVDVKGEVRITENFFSSGGKSFVFRDVMGLWSDIRNGVKTLGWTVGPLVDSPPATICVSRRWGPFCSLAVRGIGFLGHAAQRCWSLQKRLQMARRLDCRKPVKSPSQCMKRIDTPLPLVPFPCLSQDRKGCFLLRLGCPHTLSLLLKRS